jgi:hypothetical protein
VVALGCAPVGQATVLLFEAAPGGTCSLASYGDRVKAKVQKGCQYGENAGFTPKVRVEYLPDLKTWASGGYGDLRPPTLYAANLGVIQVTLKADPGFGVVLKSFNLGGWQYADYRVKSVQVQDDRGRVLFSRPMAAVRGEGPSHTSFRLSGVAARVLKIRVDARNLGSSDSDNIGIDDIVFGQRRVSGQRPKAA